MSEKISLLKPLPDGIFSFLDESQIRFFTTVGFNFCYGLSVSSFITLLNQYKSLDSISPENPVKK